MKKAALILLIFSAGVLCGALFLYLNEKGLLTKYQMIPHEHRIYRTITESAGSLQDAFNAAAEKAMPAVVVIKTSVKNPYRKYSRNEQEEMLRRYLGIKDSDDADENFVPSGFGSGFFVNEKGYIVTNYHIVKGQGKLTVRLQNKEEFEAEVVGVDPKADLAVVKINAGRETPFLHFAKTANVKVGHWAIAIGAPYALDYTVTAGIVSHKGRDVGLNVYENYIQTDAAINPGNSGGPLLNLAGEVIGVNDFIMTSSPSAKGSIGLSFAISSDIAEESVRALIEKGSISRAWLGIAYQEAPKSILRANGTSSGLLVSGVYRNSPADKAGIKAGDIIYAIDGEKLDNIFHLRNTIAKHQPGSTITLKIIRNGEESELKVKAREQPSVLSGE